MASNQRKLDSIRATQSELENHYIDERPHWRGDRHLDVGDGRDPVRLRRRQQLIGFGRRVNGPRRPEAGRDATPRATGSSATIRAAWDALTPGCEAVIVGLASADVEVNLPLIEFLSEKTLKGSYYDSADPAEVFPGLIALVRSARLELGDVVSHLIRSRGNRGGLRAPAPRRGRPRGRDHRSGARRRARRRQR